MALSMWILAFTHEIEFYFGNTEKVKYYLY